MKPKPAAGDSKAAESHQIVLKLLRMSLLLAVTRTRFVNFHDDDDEEAPPLAEFPISHCTSASHGQVMANIYVQNNSNTSLNQTEIWSIA